MAKKSLEKYPGQRNKEKYELYKPYQLRVIVDLYKQRFFEHFGNRCYKCGKLEKAKPEEGSPPNLCMDHHLPMALGGHLVPGNLVALCQQCNEQKLDKHPTDFYTTDELARLQPLLDSQEGIFAFSFNWDLWAKNRELYLLAIGVDIEVVNAALNDEHFVGYVGNGENQVAVTINIGEEFLENIHAITKAD